MANASARLLPRSTRPQTQVRSLPNLGKKGEAGKASKWMEVELDVGAPRDEEKKGYVEKLWRELFSDPSEWRDYRLGKINPRFPDFRHKTAQKALWLNSDWIPPWVTSKLAGMPSGTIESSTFSWNQRLSKCAQAGQYEETMQLFHQMQRDGMVADRLTVFPVLKACANLGLLKQGRRIHREIVQPGFEADLFIGSSLVDMYAKCGSIEEAERVFNQMPTRNVVTWTAMIVGYVKCGEGHKALELFERMQQEGVSPNSVTFVGVLNTCASVAAIDEGRRVHKEIIRRGYESDVFVGSSLVDMYTKCGQIEEAERVFYQLPTRNVVTWTAMILGYAKCGEGQQALELYSQMQQEGVDPDPLTFVAVLNACSSLPALEEGRRAHEEIIDRGYESHVFVGSSLVDMYSKCGSIEEAEEVFHQMPTRNVAGWTAMIMGYAKYGEEQKALELFEKMQLHGVTPNPLTFVGVLNACANVVALEAGRRAHEDIIRRGYESDIFVGSSLVDMYAKCGSIEEAEKVFNQLPTRNVVAWTAMIMGYVKCGEGQRALDLFEQMQQNGVVPSPVTFVGVLNACASVAALDEGRHAHQEIIRRGYACNTFVRSSLIDMYAKCGSIEEAEKVFNQMPTTHAVAWTAMIHGYGTHGYVKESLDTFRRMCSTVEADGVTFTSLLSACSHGGLVDEGLEYFKSMSSVYNITPTVEHYACVVDLLGRAGRLREAEDLIRSMPLEPNPGVWMSLLGACRIHGDVEMGKRGAKQVLELDPRNGAAQVLLSNIYVAACECHMSV